MYAQKLTKTFSVHRFRIGYVNRTTTGKFPTVICPKHREERNRKIFSFSQEISEGKAGEWLNLAFPHNQGFKDENDLALKEALNEVCNMTLAALLKEDEDEIIAIQDELYSLGEFFSKQGNNKAALLMYVLYKFCNHEVPKEANNLDGLYKEAFEKIGGMLEDSGWELRSDEQSQKKDETQ